jgi:hypothetical protein
MALPFSYGGYGLGYGGFGLGMPFPNNYMGTLGYGGYPLNNGLGYSSGEPANPTILPYALDDLQTKPIIDWPFYHGPHHKEKPALFSQKWFSDTTPKEAGIDVIFALGALAAIGLGGALAIKSVLRAPGIVARGLVKDTKGLFFR